VERLQADHAGKAMQWSGTLVAEWRDRGLDELQERNLRHAPVVLFALGLLAGLMVFVGLRPMGALFYCGFLALFLVGPPLWLRLRHRHVEKVILTLDQDALRVTRQSGQTRNVKELARSEAGLLVRWVSEDMQKRTRRLQLENAAGLVAIDLFERDVQVRSMPFGMDLKSLGIGSTHVPLDVLLGSWWPDPGRRLARTRRPILLKFLAVPDRSWGRPDLDGYALWKARGQAKDGLWIVAAGIFPLSLMVLLLPSSNAAGDWSAVGALFAVCFACVSIGTWRAWRSRTGLKQLIADLISSRIGGILNRDG
jgi:hypothetical protein